MEATCTALAGLYDDPVHNNIDCPWDWKGQQLMPIIGTNPADKFQVLLDKFDKQGIGYHASIVSCAGLFKSLNVNPEVASDLLYKASEEVTRRPLQPGEIENAIAHAYQERSLTARKYITPKKEINDILMAEIAKDGDCDALRAKSKKLPLNARQILRDFYDAEDLIHLTRDVFNGREVLTRDEWIDQGPENFQYITPNPLKDRDNGRTLMNIKERRFIVFESDLPTVAEKWDAQAGLIDRLALDMPLRMVVWSGNKSLHAWYDVRGQKEEHVYDFCNLAVTIGADSASLRPSQLVRMPFGHRKDLGKEQKVIYYG